MAKTLSSDALQPASGKILKTIGDSISLRQFSPSDKKWDDRRAESDCIGELYRGTILDPLAAKIEGCAQQLGFRWEVGEIGEAKLKLHTAWFCRCRHCAVCQWRKSVVWRARAFQAFPKIVEAYPKHRFIFLTLTIRNCSLAELRATLIKMSKAWARLTARKQWPAVGWLRSVEVTRGENDTAHPHYHCLLMVKPNYFNGKYYLSQQTWTDLWQASLQVDYPPIVDVRTVKPMKGNDDNFKAILETLKYTIKPSYLIGKGKAETVEQDKEWLVELTYQLKGTRSVASGGILKEYFKELEAEPEDLIHVNEQGETEDNLTSATIVFAWNKPVQQYLLQEDDSI